MQLSTISEGLQRNSKKERRRNLMLFTPKEKGQGLVEYALILVLVAVVIIAVVIILGPVITNYIGKPTPTLTP
jgi:pilus assembly protein Flp/PilA